MPRHRKSQSGQVMVLVAVSLIALIGSAALVLVAGSAEWQKNQLQQVADQAALEAALKIGIGCTFGEAKIVIDAADASIGKQRTAFGAYSGVVGGPCATGYTGTQTFTGGALSATITYPYRAHQQQVEVVLTLTLPISFGGVVGSTSTQVIRRAVAQALPGSVPTLSATMLTCLGGQVNIAGSVLAQNPVMISGGCVLYSHARFDATSSTYSDLGNTSVYTGGQAWGAGSCVSAPSNVICADGSELTGNVTPTCGTTTAFLSAGDAVINPNPCAAGVARPPVPFPPTNLPPEPNTDQTAINTLGTGGVRCSAVGTPGPILVNGKLVGTSLAAAPTIPDANGFYHFKPSCYGYLDPSKVTGGGGGITNRQTGPAVGPATGTLKLTLPANSLAGTLLVATIRSDTNASQKPFTAPAGWISAIPGGAFLLGTAHTEIWYYPSNPGGIGMAPLGVDFGVSPGSIDAIGQLTEWSGVAAAALDASGTLLSASNQLSVTVSTSPASPSANDLVITDIGVAQQSPQTYTGGAGWTNLATNISTEGFASDYKLNVAAGGASEMVAVSKTTTWASMIAAFKPAGGGGGGAGAVLDPGFYYFNGWDGTGYSGGGICLNGGTLLAQTVTLEFVNQAGFSSGDCTVGGGAACSSPCQFGSGSVADSTFTYFSAPCSQAPAGDSSCPGPGWCTNGDRACLNVLIWSSSTGQIAIKGANAKHWLLGSIYWPGTCTDTVNGTSTIAGTLFCGNLTISAAAGAGTAIGGDYGIATSLVEANLIE
jgi:hypothetical protein